MGPVPRGPLVAAFITAASSSGFDIGDGAAPASGSFPYAVVYPLPDLDREGSIDDGQASSIAEIQVTTVGRTREQAHALMDALRLVLLAPGSLSIPGWKVNLVELAPATGGIQRDDDVQPPLFYGIDSYSVRTTPA